MELLMTNEQITDLIDSMEKTRKEGEAAFVKNVLTSDCERGDDIIALAQHCYRRDLEVFGKEFIDLDERNMGMQHKYYMDAMMAYEQYEFVRSIIDKDFQP
jgi:hypothetical protein